MVVKSLHGKRALAVGTGAMMAVAILPGMAMAQAQSANEAVLEQQSEQLQQRFDEERRKLEEMEIQLNQIREQMKALHPSATTVPQTTPQNTRAAGSTVRVQEQQPPANTPSPGGGGTNLQASSGSRKTPAASAAVEAAYQAQNALFRPGLTFYPQFQYNYTNSQNLILNGFLAFGSIFLGNVNVSRTETNIYNWNPQIYYAFTRRFELDVNLPYFLEQATYSEVGANSTTSQSSQVHITKWGIGDAQGGFYWQVAEQHNYWPDMIFNLQVSAPTGTSPYGIKLLPDPNNNNLKFPSNLPTGKGVWGISSGLSLIRELDPVVLFASGNYYYEFTEHVSDVSSVPGTVQPGKVAPGNALAFTMGTTVALNERLSTMVELQDIINNGTEVKPNHGTWSAVPGTDATAASFIFGATYAASRNLFPFIQAGIGATQAAPNFQISLWVPYYFSF